MIRRIRLHECKTYSDGVVDLIPGVNIITGGSGHGKSNILSGFKWLLTGKPSKNKCIRRGQPRGEVEVSVEDDLGREFTASRFKAIKGGEDGYAITSGGKPVGEYEGSTVPADVIELLNMTDLNIHKQLGTHFLVFDTPGKIAAYVRSVTKLNEIDLARKSIASKKRAASDALTLTKSDLELKIGQLKELKLIDLETMQTLIDLADRLEEENDELTTDSRVLEKIIDDIEKIDRFSLTLPDNTDIIIDEAEEHMLKCDTDAKDAEALKDTLDEIRELDASMREINWAHFLNVEKEALELVESNTEYNNQIDSLMCIIEDITTTDIALEEIATAIAKEEAEYQELLKDLDECPECGGELTDECKIKLLENGA